MKKIFFISLALIFVLSGMAFADELRIPISCWPKELKEEFAKTGRKLDLTSGERSNESWGYIVNNGSEFVLFTYQSVTQEDFDIIQKIVFKIEREKRESHE